MAEFDSILSCTIGTSSFQLTGYTKSADGIYDDAGSRIGTKIAFGCDGEIIAADASALASALAAFEADASTDGANFSISGHGIIKEQLLAADCTEGPIVKFAYGSEQGHNCQSVSFTVEGTKAVDPNEDGILSSTQRTQTQVNLEGLKVVTISGKVITTGSPTASTVVLVGVGAEPVPLIPTRPAGWQQTYSYNVNENDTECSYEVTQTELVNEYPASGGDPVDRVVDGERTVSTSYDEHNRKTTNYNYSYTGPHAEAYIESMHTSLRGANGLVRASISVTYHKTLQATGQFEVLNKRTGTNLLELTETISHARSGPLLKEVRYAGTSPLIIQTEQAGYLYTQSGRAIGLQQYPQPPAYKFAVANLADAPEIAVNRPNDNEFETTWRFRYLFPTEQSMQFPSARSGSPGFYGG